MSKRSKTARRKAARTIRKQVNAALRAADRNGFGAERLKVPETGTSTSEVPQTLRIATAPGAADRVVTGPRMALAAAVRVWAEEVGNPVAGLDDDQVIALFFASLQDTTPGSDAFFVQEGDLGVTLRRCPHCAGSGLEVTR